MLWSSKEVSWEGRHSGGGAAPPEQLLPPAHFLGKPACLSSFHISHVINIFFSLPIFLFGIAAVANFFLALEDFQQCVHMGMAFLPFIPWSFKSSMVSLFFP